jgi:hypothetical protein
MGLLKKVLKLQDAVTSDTGLENLQNIIEKENPEQVMHIFIINFFLF